MTKPGSRDELNPNGILTRPLDAITVHSYGTSDQLLNVIDCIDRKLLTTSPAMHVWLEEFGFGDNGSTCAKPFEPPALAATKVMPRAEAHGIKSFYWDLVGDDSGVAWCNYGLFDNAGMMRPSKFCGIKRYLWAKSSRAMTRLDECFMTKFEMDWLHRFDDLRAGRVPVSGWFRSLGREEIFVVDAVDRSSWVGDHAEGSSKFIKSADAQDYIEPTGPMWAGYFTDGPRQEILLFNPDERSWFLGTFHGERIAYTRAAQTGHLGGVEDGALFWVGRFSGPGREELLFWSPKDKNYRLGRVTQASSPSPSSAIPPASAAARPAAGSLPATSPARTRTGSCSGSPTTTSGSASSTAPR